MVVNMVWEQGRGGREYGMAENSFKFKGNQLQFELNTDISEDIHSAIKFIVSDRKSKVVSISEVSITKLKKRNKLMRIADKSEEVERP